MTQWEYQRVHRSNRDTAEESLGFFNEMGAQGWEAFAIILGDKNETAVIWFKRPKG